MITEIKTIALMTDFGLKDGYVGVMKGIMTMISPQSRIIDISHQIPPQNVAAGRFCLMNAYPYFPPETVFVGVVDPGVGSERRGIGVKLEKGYYIGPDNGLISGILRVDTVIKAVNLTNSQYWRVSPPSFTFHGRDIFAPVAAYLAKGVELEQLGNEINPDSLQQLSLEKIQVTSTQIKGCVQYIDSFGNLITNIYQDQILADRWQVKIKNKIIPQGTTYATLKRGKFISLIGSHGWLEIAVNGGNAQEKLGVKIGEKIMLESLL